MIPNVGWVVAAFAAGVTVTRERPAAAPLVDGIATPAGPPTTTAIELLWLPQAGDDLERASEGQRAGATLDLFAVSTVDLRGGDAATGTLPDVVIVRGFRYQVETVEPWAEAGAGYRRFRCRRVEV